jgi:uncharacterized protein (TIGR00299 family) protein
VIAHIEAVGGAAGNMLLGALVDAGAELDALEDALRTVVADGWTLERSRVTRRGIAATSIEIVVPGEDGQPGTRTRADGHGVHLADVLAIVDGSGLKQSQKDRASHVYRTLGAAEARVHGTSTEAIHFHEVGATDAILDVAGFVVACDLLGIEALTCAPVPIGTGEIVMSHGRYPNPPPATAELLRGMPTYDAKAPGELVTPTAAAILKSLCTAFGGRPEMTVSSIGYGAGSRDGDLPNVTRVSVGTPVRAPGGETDRSEVSVLEANVDDMSPQFFELAIERLFAAGALDVWLSPVTMKKGRPAIVIAAIVPLELEAACAQILLRETTTIGVRVRTERRYTMEREIRSIDSLFGAIRVKDVRSNGTRRTMPEYDDVLRIAREHNLPIQTVYRAVEAALEDR